MDNKGKLVGYARVSTQEQELSLQLDALKRAGCKKEDIFIDKISGMRKDRVGLDECLEKMQKGDTLVVWKFDRLSRSLRHLIDIVEGLKEREIGFKSITEELDTTSAGGTLIFHVFGSFAEFERQQISERTKAGLEAARARGKKGGRPVLNTEDKNVQLAKMLYNDTSKSIKDICEMLEISKPTLYNYRKMWIKEKSDKVEQI